jgi:lipopolysaccharide/colanic/teichoic acid biosynthesis glycosyltransferase
MDERIPVDERIPDGTGVPPFPDTVSPVSVQGRHRASARDPVLPVGQGIRPSWPRRLLDIAVAVAVLSLLWLPFLVLVMAIRLSTGGTAIYRQRRVGQGGIPFTLYKFRTMRVHMEGPEVTAPGDDRVTWLGALMRRTSIDELPQMLNVLIGHMTLVGPRPESVALARRYPEEFWFIFRYRPGVTGPCQVLVRDEKVLGRASDVENFYLTELLPHRVDKDLDFLKDPTLVRTVRWLAITFLYLIHTAKPALGPAEPGPAGAALVAPADD